MFKKLYQHIILLSFIFAISINNTDQLKAKDLVGNFSAGGECSYTKCPRTHFDKYDFVCPVKDDIMEISEIKDSNGKFLIKFKGYNIVKNADFQAEFQESDIQQLGEHERGILSIPLKDGYKLNIQPCYDGSQTNSICNNSSFRPEFIAWKTNKKGQQSKGCDFIMTKKYGSENIIEDQ